MKRLNTIFLFAAGLFFASLSHAQNVTYSDILKEDRKDMVFEILGKFGGNYLVYKNYQQRPYITIYNNNMTLKENVGLGFISNKVINIDFIPYPDKILLFYQYQKGNIVYCYGAQLNPDGKQVDTEKLLDTTKVNFFADNKFYGMSYSEDKKKILIYKSVKKDRRLTIATKVYSDKFDLLDNSRDMYEVDERRETYKDLSISNTGNIVFLKETNTVRSDFAKELSMFKKTVGAQNFSEIPINLKENRIDDSEIKIDNINKQYVVVAFSLEKKNSNYITGMFTAIIPEDTTLQKIAVNNTLFSDSLKYEVSNSNTIRDAFDRFFVKNIILKKDGSFLITTEEQYVDTRNNNWNRYNSYYPGYYGMSDYYYYYPRYSTMYYPYGYGYYDRWGSNRNDDLYYANDIVTFSFDKSLNMSWAATIMKSTSDVGSKNFLSYSTANYDGEVHFFFIQNDKNKQIINNFGMRPDGTINRYPTLKSREKGYYFMPSYGKQVGAREVIIPSMFRNNIAFVKVEF